MPNEAYAKKNQLIARWDGFLARVQERFNESTQQGTEAILQSLDDNDYDYYSSLRVLTSIQDQIRDSLIQKIEETWSEKVEPEMRANDLDDEGYYIDESFKAPALNDSLDSQLRMWFAEAVGRLSRKFYDRAIQTINKTFLCTQCHAPLTIRPNFFQAQYVACNFCTTVNTFEPDTKYVQIGWNVINNIAQLNAINEFKAMESANFAASHVDRHKPAMNAPTAAAAKIACRVYFEKYFQERIKLLPDTAATYQQDVDHELKQSNSL